MCVQEAIPGPLHDVVIAVSKKLLLNQTEYNKIVKDLGGSYSWKQEIRHTHFIFQVSFTWLHSGRKVDSVSALNPCSANE